VYATAARIKDEIDLRIKQKAEIVKDITLTDEMEKYAADCNKEKTAQGYRYAYKLLAEFMGKNVIYFEDITYSTIDSFDKYLARQKKMSINSRSIILRKIRAVFNHAIKYDLISADLYPFKRFEIKKGVAEKEVLSLGELRELINLNLTGSLAKARDFFVLSFLLCGVNPIDLYQMENANKKGIVTFVREKIEHTEPEPMHLHIEEQALDIINRYKGEKFLLNFKEKHDYETFTRRTHRYLKIVGDMIGRNLYMYIARHTWATMADQLDIPHEIISKALGHTDKSTAERYYIRFDWTKVHRANKQVIDYVYSTSSTC
jgi:integrase